MGACGGKMSAAEAEEQRKDRLIARANKKDADLEQKKIKLLLLGAGESGKSTIFKQLKLLHGKKKAFTDNELSKAALTIYSNIIADMQELILQSNEYGPYDPSLKEAADAITLLPYEAPTAYIDEAVARMIKEVWADEGIQQTWAQRSHFQVQDALRHYCENIERIGVKKYVPEKMDVLLTRVRTSGIVEEHYTIDGVDFVMFDVGGQRNERRKWIHCFQDVTAVIFVAAINEYDQQLFEDEKVNRMDEAVILFDEICNSKWFQKTSMILFLNKKDLFREKLPTNPFRNEEEGRYTDFDGPHVEPDTPSATIGTPEYEDCYEAASQYLLKLFISRKKNPNKKIYSHITEATNTDNVSHVFDACRDVVLRDNLAMGGFFASSDGGV